MTSPRPVMVRSVLVLASGAVLLAVAAAGCSGPPDSPAPEQMRATAAPSPALAPADPPPKDFRTISGAGYTVSAPSAYQATTTTSRNGEPSLMLKRPSSVTALPATVAVIRDVDPTGDVVEQSYAIEVSKRALAGVSEISRGELTWPGAQRAVLLQWTQDVAVGDGTVVATRYVQLNVQVTESLILAVVALAPVVDVEGSAIRSVVATLRPDGAAG